ncbi:MAG: TonB-dependent receptor plug domain-containing protein [Tannerella sp.]|jgi:TonB-dependent SusC/RagA subfamily outer membrane receptor|nr:TonB-dependent receptor plug domain-containing protein [Tannerella sp.]
MKTKTFYTILFLLTGLSLLTSFAFDSDLSFVVQLKNKLRQYNEKYAEEKLYVQTDKTIYKPGEYIFYNVFLTEAATGKPSVISDIVYVELYDPKGTLVEKQTLNVRDGLAGGHCRVDESHPGGLYTIKGYTLWITNFGEDRIFKKEIQVQKVITPRLLLKIDFRKKAYGKGDEVIADLKVSDLKNVKAANAKVNVKVNIAGRLAEEFTVATNQSGEAEIKFGLPVDLNTTDVLVQAIVYYEGVQESISRTAPVVLDNITLRFFPEGGSWVYGTSGCLAFEAINEFGKGADVSGDIIDEDDRVVTSFESFHFGMGSFRLIPEEGKKYYARIKRPAGNETPVELPSPQTGFMLNLKETSGKTLKWKVYTPGKTKAYIGVSVHGVFYEGKTIGLKKGDNTVDFDIAGLPGGVGVFTLFDAKGKPMCERLVMLNPQKQLNISIEADKVYYEPGEKVVVDLKATDDNGTPVQAMMGLSVVDEQILTMADDKQDNILTYMWLSSELEGKIYEPSFYFNKEEKKSDRAVDYLLLTHGWRIYTWDDVITQDKPLIRMAENLNDGIYGYLVDEKGEPRKGIFYLFETEGKRRVLKLETNEKGQFMFLNTDPTVSALLLTRKPNKVRLIDKSMQAFGIMEENTENPLDESWIIEDLVDSELITETEMFEDLNIEIMSEEVVSSEVYSIVQEYREPLSDEVALEDIVVVGYGARKKQHQTGAAFSIEQDYLRSFDGFAGRVAGVNVKQQDLNPAMGDRMRIRGSSSVVNNNSPLFVVDGVLMESQGDNFDPLSAVNMNSIESLTFMKDAVASSLYGSRGMNGVILINTRRPNFPYTYKTVYKEPFYNASYVFPKSNKYIFREAKEYYTLLPRIESEDGVREDFRTTVYWKDKIKTDTDGKAQITFFNNDANSAFRITTEGITHTGLAGRAEFTYSTRMPLSLDMKIPNYMNYSDRVELSVSVRNNTTEVMSPDISFAVPEGLILEEMSSRRITIQPEMSEVITFTLRSAGVTGKFPVEINLKEKEFSDMMKHEIEVYPVGFPRSVNISGRDRSRSGTVVLSDMEPKSLRGEATVHLSVFDELFSGVEAILREPYGCFEQTSSMTFPNIFVMQLMNATGSGTPQIQKRAMTYIESGYKRLTGYEIKTGGFEWFGSPPAHEALTAYGLVEFYEMSKVYHGVSREMMERTKKWLLGRRDENGLFIQTKGKYAFASVPYDVNCAYFMYALTETGVSYSEIEKAYQYSLKEAENSRDLYRMSLMALAARNLKRMDEYKRLVSYFEDAARPDPYFKEIKVQTTIVSSSYQHAVVEAVALWAVALIRDASSDVRMIEQCINFISSRRTGYGYGNTQATSLALKALTDYAVHFMKSNEDGVMSLMVNGTAVTIPFTKDMKESVVDTDFVKYLTEGTNKLEVTLNSKVSYPYSIVLNWNTKTPESAGNCPLHLTAKLSQNKVRINETVRLTVSLKNKENKGQPMSIAVIGIPAGLSPQPWQLKELQEKGAFDYYEISGNRLAFFYRGLISNDIKEINLDLKADIPGEYTGAASSGYLYYTPEERHWNKGLEISITK